MGKATGALGIDPRDWRLSDLMLLMEGADMAMWDKAAQICAVTVNAQGGDVAVEQMHPLKAANYRPKNTVVFNKKKKDGSA